MGAGDAGDLFEEFFFVEADLAGDEHAHEDSLSSDAGWIVRWGGGMR